MRKMRYHIGPSSPGQLCLPRRAAGICQGVIGPIPFRQASDFNVNLTAAISISSTSPVSQYKYGGKEWNPTSLSYDFGARNYLPAVPRWNSMDPLAEKYYSISPYVYCAGNPVNLVDLDGRNPIVMGVISALLDAGIQIGGKMIEGESLIDSVHEIDITSVISAGVTGALSPGKPITRIVGFVIQTLDAVVDYSTKEGFKQTGNSKENNSKTEIETITDFISGALGTDVGNVISRNIAIGLKKEASSTATATLSKEMKQYKKALSDFANKKTTKGVEILGTSLLSKMGGEAVKTTQSKTNNAKTLVLIYEQQRESIQKQDVPKGLFFVPSY